MRNLLWCTTLGLILSVSSVSAAEEHTIKARPDLNWEYKNKHAQITIVDGLQIGDVIIIVVPGGTHGFTTIKKTPPPITPIETPVLKCGEPPEAKPAAMLKETECGAESQFGKEFVGQMKIEVLPSFTGDVPFWCVRHKQAMQGVLRLKGAVPPAVKVTGHHRARQH